MLVLCELSIQRCAVALAFIHRQLRLCKGGCGWVWHWRTSWLAAGGENVYRSLDLLESYDPSANFWQIKSPNATEFTRTTPGVVNGKMYVFGNALTLEYDPGNEIR